MSSNLSSSAEISLNSSAASCAELASWYSLAREMSSVRSAERCSILMNGCSLRLMLLALATVICAFFESSQKLASSILRSSSCS